MNAIILAAGMGTRLRPLTNDIPKCLVPILGEPIVERTIKYLQQTGIRDITLVSGYKADRLTYLQDKYGVDIVHNELYDSCNNIYSLYKVLDRFANTYVIEGDVYLSKNCFLDTSQQSCYIAKHRASYTKEWGLEVDNNQRLIRIVPGSGSGYIMSGVSFWVEEDARVIAHYLQEILRKGDYSNLFWDEILLRHHKELDIVVREFPDMYEIDTVDELRELETLLVERHT